MKTKEEMVAEGNARRAKALAMSRDGKTLREIGEYFGVCRERARQLVASGSRREQAHA